jgi:hypothetical protein
MFLPIYPPSRRHISADYLDNSFRITNLTKNACYLLWYMFSVDRQHNLLAESFLTRLLLQLVKKFPAFYGTRKFIAAFTRARYTCPYPATDQYIPRPFN